MDGAKGLRAAVDQVWVTGPSPGCQWHKEENVVGQLREWANVAWRRRVQGVDRLD